MELTGIAMFKYMNDEWRGTVMNEFGVKAFDFVAPQGKCKLQNVLPFMDKWYIRRTIVSDFSHLLWGVPTKGKSLAVSADGAFVLKNEKYNIEYSFQPIDQ